MLSILNSVNAHNFPIFEPILMILVSKFKVHRVLSDKTYLPLGLLSPLIIWLELTMSKTNIRPSIVDSFLFILTINLVSVLL